MNRWLISLFKNNILIIKVIFKCIKKIKKKFKENIPEIKIPLISDGETTFKCLTHFFSATSIQVPT